MSLEVNATVLDLIMIESAQYFITNNDAEIAYYKLESIGYKVGLSLSEKLTREKSRFLDNLDVVKWICKEFWIILFKKQIDNLKTNHKGVYVLTDTNFKWFQKMSAKGGQQETTKQMFPFLAFPCGVLRGVLCNLGVDCVVIGEVTAIPQCMI
ncbi:Trafficking protein particle complex subunit 33 [Lobulomyces angularis]|nr:Trafficking protein particle complex subunit 33 [Lobulomyces angularis]